MRCSLKTEPREVAGSAEASLLLGQVTNGTCPTVWLPEPWARQFLVTQPVRLACA